MKNTSFAFRVVASIVTALCLWVPDRRVVAQELSVADVKQRIGEFQTRFWEIPGGVEINYRVVIKQGTDPPFLIWKDGLVGELVVRWPEMRSLNRGEMYCEALQNGKFETIVEYTDREVYYDFKTDTSVARDGTDMGQVAPYRHSFSGDSLYPLSLQFFDKASVPKPNSTKRNLRILPSGILPDEASIKSEGELLVITQGLSVLWVDPAMGCAVVKREIRLNEGAVYERTENSDWREIAAGVWHPMKQRRRVFDIEKSADGSILKLDFELQTTSVTVGEVSTEDLKVVFDKSVAVVEDQIANRIYRSSEQQANTFDYAVSRVMDRRHIAGGWNWLLLSVVAGALVAAVVYVRMRAARRSGKSS